MVLSACTQEKSDPVVDAQVGQSQDAREVPELLDHTVNAITGDPVDLASFEGKVVLIVNVASRCGLTPQYGQLQAIYQQRADEGLVVLGFPANDFGAQEPGSNAEIQEFCSVNYGVSFPMFEKIAVTGTSAHPLFQQLSHKSEPPTWNFTKYLIDSKGEFVARFGPRINPQSPELVAAIDSALQAIEQH